VHPIEQIRKPGPQTKRKPIFDVQAFLEKIGEGRSILYFAKNQLIFAQGKSGDAVFYIQKGRVKLSVVSKEGKEAVIALLGPHAFIGEGALVGQKERVASATTLSDCSILRIEKDSIEAVLRDEPSFSKVFLHFLLTRGIRMEEDLVDHLFNSSEKRLARVLLLLANFGKEGKTEPLIPKISQSTLAEIVGTTRSRVSFFMTRFKKLGYIHCNGGIEVHSSLLNVILRD
jgi:CRP/FNR family transcriptional regulator, cyclic AMP receptor protein